MINPTEPTMVRARVWLVCAAMHDPVSPVLVEPCRIGWQARRRTVDLVIDFTSIESTKENLKTAVSKGRAMVIGNSILYVWRLISTRQ